MTDPEIVPSGLRVRGRTERSDDPVTVRSLDVRTGATVAHLQGGGADSADRLVDVASDAFDGWRATELEARGALLRRIAARFRAAAATSLAATIVQETGKRLEEARAELHFSAAYFEQYARLAEERGRPWWPGSGGGHLAARRAVGVAAAVTPWNFPASIPARKIAPALAAGCTLVWKPSEVVPRSSVEVASLIDAEVPEGVVGMVMGAAEDITRRWLDDRRVRVLSFTGSTPVGRTLARQATAHFCRTVLELGGQAPFVVFDDANRGAAASCLKTAKFRNNGQSCIAANVAWVPARDLDAWTETLAEVVQGLRVGDPMDPEVSLGPLALPSDPDRVERLIEDAEAWGARIVRGSSDGSGHQVAPALCVDPAPGARVNREEVFGPVLTLRPYDHLDEVVQATRDLEHGLAAYVATADRLRGIEFADRLDVGVVGVNTATPNLVAAPFGGLKGSGWGYEGGHEGMEPFLAAQMIAFQALG